MPGGETGFPIPGLTRAIPHATGEPSRAICEESPLQARRHRRGVTAVEFALILPLLMTIVLGCVDYGRFAYDYIAVTNAARAGTSMQL